MTSLNEAVLLLVVCWGILMSLAYFRERGRSRDYATDLAQLIHDHDLGREDLRRSLEWDEIERRVDRGDGG